MYLFYVPVKWEVILYQKADCMKPVTIVQKIFTPKISDLKNLNKFLIPFYIDQ
jgi:hypothetical protein